MNFHQCTEYGNEDEQYGQGTIAAGPHGHHSDQMGGDRGSRARDTCFFVQDNKVGIECRNQTSF